MKSTDQNILERWTIHKAKELYGVPNWGAGYFDVSERGEVVVTSGRGNGKKGVSLVDIVSGIQARGMQMPVLLRFENILDAQIAQLNESFRKAIRESQYRGQYRGVYPIKVNQQQQIIEEITRFGAAFHHGLEAGSKAELIAAISMMRDQESCLICNGYKDEEYIDLALYATKLGIRCVIVIERPGELPILLERAKKIRTEPLLGVRVKLSSSAGGHWTESGGDRSVFGLNTVQLLEIVDQLKAKRKLGWLKLLHYHIGSQVPNIRDIRNAVTEAAHTYAGLVEEGAAMGFLDLGGGLAVDYDGSHTNFHSSKNYTTEEYCADIIETVSKVLDEKGIAHPDIVTESGRATVAYSSVLLFNILDVNTLANVPMPAERTESLHEHTRSLIEIGGQINSKNVQESFHDAIYYRDEIRYLFRHGGISLRERSVGESAFWNIVYQIARELKKMRYIPDEFENIDSSLADIYYGNFSVFQSLPDIWAIDQLFPIMPIHRLNEAPTRLGIISDITCDCDGKIDKFIDLHDVRRTLQLHELKPDEEYYLAVFLVGAYQETLGDLHNLFGDTNVLGIRLDDEGGFEIVKEIDGDSVEDVLSYVEYNTKEIIARIKRLAERTIQNGTLSPIDRKEIMKVFEEGIHGYTYFEREL